MDAPGTDASPPPSMTQGPLEPRLRFEEAVAPLLPRMRAHALRLTRSAPDADDLVQEAMLRAYRFWPSYREDSRLSAWLARIVRNTFINGYRRRRREREALSIVRELALCEQAAAADDAAESALSQEVDEALSALPVEFRRVLWAVAVDDLSYGEAANSLGCPVGTVMSRLHRARRALAPALREHAVAVGCL